MAGTFGNNFYLVQSRNRGGAVPAAAAFSPSDIANLQLWLIADDISGSNNDPVSQWDDHRGAGTNSLTQSGSNRPKLVTGAQNGYKGVNFDVFSSQYMNIGTPFNNSSASETQFVVCKIDNIAAVVFLGNGSAGTLSWVFVNSGQVKAYDNTNYYLSTLQYPDLTSYHLMSTKKVPATSFAFRYDKTDATMTSTAPDSSNQSYNTFGFSNSYNYAALTVVEFICYNAALSGTDITNVENYLNTKYALGL